MTTLTHLDAISDRTLKRMVTWGAVVLAMLLIVFGTLYYLGQRPSGGPTLAERQVSAAEDAVKAAPQNVQTRLQLAAAYMQAARYDDASAQYTEILKAIPGNHSALLGLGSVKMKNGDLDGATTLFSQVTSDAKQAEFTKVDPQVEAAWYFLGSIAAQQNKLDQAVSDLTTALKLDPTDSDSLYLLGTVQTKKGDTKSAIASLRRALLFVPTGWPEPYAALSDAYTQTHQSDEAAYASAMADFANEDASGAASKLESLTEGPAAVDVMLGLGLIAETSSERTSAVSWYQKVLAKDPGNSTAQSGVARLTGPGSGTAPSAAPTTQAKES